MTTKKDVIKHSAVIQISHKISLLEQHLFNALLAEAFDELKTTSIHSVNIDLLKEYVPGINSVKNLEIMLKNLRDTSVEYNIFEKDKRKEWGCLSLLAGVRIGKFNKICYFSFAPELIPALSDRTLYAKINLKLQKEYKGGQYGWALYELCRDYKTSITKIPEKGRTPEKSIAVLRIFFGIDPGKYKEYRDFNRRVVQPAIKEVNDQTDLFIKSETKKKGQAINSISFYITKNPKYKKFLNLPIEKIAIPYQKDNITAVLEEFKVPQKTIETLRKTYSGEKIEQAMEIIAENEKKGSIIKNSGAYLKQILSSMDDTLKSKAPEDKETEAKQQAEDKATDLKLYQGSTNEERFDEVYKRQPDQFKRGYKTLSKEDRKLFRERFDVLFTQYDNFDDVHSEWGSLLNDDEF